MDFSTVQAVMFDFDGTITEPGDYQPHPDIIPWLVKLTHQMPISFCTGRQLESFEDHGLEYLMKAVEKSELESFLENLYLVAENGSIGYRFNTDLDRFEEYYKVAWPEEVVERADLMKKLDEYVSEYGEVYFKKHRVVVVMRTKEHTSGDIEAIHACSAKIFELTQQFMSEMVPNYEDYFNIGNSGIGVIICPKDGDKSRGIKEFGRYLQENEGMKLGPKLREIVCIGDRPEKGGNDHDFLKGEVGSPFTVGNIVENAEYPKPVLGLNGEQIKHYEGTIEMIKKITT